MAAQKRREINLLPQTEFETSGWGRFLSWAVSWGRYILILVELVVIIAFLSRFKLDRDTTNLKETIAGQVAIVKAASDSESKFRSTQSRLKAAATIIGSQTGLGANLDRVSEKIPPGVGLTQLNLGEKEITLTATTVSPEAMGELLARLSADKKWSAELVEVASLSPGEIKFTVKVTL